MKVNYRDESIRFCKAAFGLLDDRKAGRIPMPWTLAGNFQLSISEKSKSGFGEDSYGLALRDLDKPKNLQIVSHTYNTNKYHSQITRIGNMLARYLELLQIKCEDM